jgi:hypothetical protein
MRVSLVKNLDEFGSVFHLRSGKPRVFRIGVSLPFDEVLYFSLVGGWARL